MTDDTRTGGKTVQLRRYRLMPGELDAFITWWAAELAPVRLASGYAIEFS